MQIESLIMLIIGIIAVILIVTLLGEFFIFIRNLYDNHKHRQIQRDYYDKYDDPFYTESKEYFTEDK